MLIFHPASNEIKYSYYHSLPQEALLRRPVRVAMYIPNYENADTYAQLEAKIKNESIPLALKNAEQFKYTLIVPVAPCLKSEEEKYNDKPASEFYERPDAVIHKMLKSFFWMLKVNGYTVHQKIFIYAEKRQAKLANLISILYPDVVQAIKIVDAELLMYPVDALEGTTLNYPFGTADIVKLQPNTYSQETFKKITYSITTTDETISETDQSSGEKEIETFIKKTFGSDIHERNANFARYLTDLGMSVNLEIKVKSKTQEMLIEEAFKFFDTIKTPAY
jgi:hypothetical protein